MSSATAATLSTVPQTMTLNQACDAAMQALQSGDLQGAANLCADIHAAEPNFWPMHLLMSDIFIAARDFAKAWQWAESARGLQLGEAESWFQCAKVRFNEMRMVEAKLLVEQALNRNNQAAIYHVMLADVLFEQGQHDAALARLVQVRSLSGLSVADQALIEEHEGLIHLHMGDLARAKSCFESLIKQQPMLGRAHLNLAKIAIQQGDAQAGAAACERAIEYAPELYEAWNIRAVFAFKAGQFDLSAEYAKQALMRAPEHIHSYQVLGKSLRELRRWKDAEAVLREAYAKAPNNLVIQDDLMAVLMQNGQTDEAIVLIESALMRKPGDAMLTHLLAAARGETTETAPESYVAQLFDDYAASFEQHLQHGLRYETPQKLAAVIRDYLSKQLQPDAKHSLLDLGCGTGLAAKVLADITDYRVGVDLSPKMIDEAMKQKIYDEGHVAEIARFMAESKRQYGLITCCDVLVYIGNLEPCFAGARHVAAAGALFALSVEDGDDHAPYILRKSGRYAHAASYVEQMASAHGFSMLHREHAAIRYDRGEPIMGYLYLFHSRPN